MPAINVSRSFADYSRSTFLLGTPPACMSYGPGNTYKTLPLKTVTVFEGYTGAKPKNLVTHTLRLRRFYQEVGMSYSNHDYTGGVCAQSEFLFNFGAQDFVPTGVTNYDTNYRSNIPLLETFLKGKVLDKVADTRSNLSITIAEMDKTVAMINKRVKTLSRALLLTRKGRLSEAYATLAGITHTSPEEKRRAFKDYIRNIQNMSGYNLLSASEKRKHLIDGRKRLKNRYKWENDWLELQYGVIPLLKDTQGLAEMAAQRFTSKPHRFSCTVSGYIQSPYTPVLAYKGGAQGVLLNGPWQVGQLGYLASSDGTAVRVTVDSKLRVKGRCSMTVEVTSQTAIDFNQTVGNYAEVLWELTPLSFVADWFINVGDFIRRTTSLSGLQVIDAYVSTQLTMLTKTSPLNSKFSTGVYLSPALSSDVEYNRTPWNGDNPGFALGSLMNGRTHWSKLLTSVALLRQRLKP